MNRKRLWPSRPAVLGLAVLLESAALFALHVRHERRCADVREGYGSDEISVVQAGDDSCVYVRGLRVGCTNEPGE